MGLNNALVWLNHLPTKPKMINDLMNNKDRANDVGVLGDKKRQTTKEDVQA
jgi:hypothetical protein